MNNNTTKLIAKNTIIQLGGKTLSTFFGLIAIAIMTRHLGVERFGWYSTATGFLMFFGIICDFGFVVTTAKMLPEPNFDKQKLFNNLFTWRFLTALIFNGLAPLIIWFFPYNQNIKLGVGLLSISFFFISLNQIFVGYYQSKLKMIVQMSGEVISRIFLVIGLLLLTWGKAGFLPMMAMVSAASIVYTFYLWIKSPGIKFNIDKKISKKIFSNIWPIAIAVFANALYLQADKVILPLYVNQTDMGLYGAAYRVVDIITQITAMTMGLMLPLVSYAWSRKLKSDFAKYYQMSFDLITLTIFPMAVGVFVLATPIMKFIAGDDFTASGNILRMLSMAIIGISFGMIFGHITAAINKQRQAIFIFASDAALALTAYFILIPKYGIWGAVAVSIGAEIYAGLGLLLLARHYSKQSLKFKNFLKIITASAVMGLLVHIIPTFHILLSIILGIIIYMVMIFLLKIISPQTIKEITSKQKQVAS